MNRHIAIITLLLVMGLQAFAQKTFRPDHYAVKIEDFSELVVVNDVTVTYRQSADSAGLAVFDATRQNAASLIFNCKKGKLKIETTWDDGLPHATPSVTVYSTMLGRVENDGDSLVTVASAVPVPEFKAKVVGNGSVTTCPVTATRIDASVSAGKGTVTIAGQCQQAKYSITGKGTINAEGVKAQEVTCAITGPGTVYCDVVNQLTLKGISKGGQVYYLAEPAKTRNRSIGVKAEKLMR